MFYKICFPTDKILCQKVFALEIMGKDDLEVLCLSIL